MYSNRLLWSRGGFSCTFSIVNTDTACLLVLYLCRYPLIKRAVSQSRFSSSSHGGFIRVKTFWYRCPLGKGKLLPAAFSVGSEKFNLMPRFTVLLQLLVGETRVGIFLYNTPFPLVEHGAYFYFNMSRGNIIWLFFCHLEFTPGTPW